MSTLWTLLTVAVAALLVVQAGLVILHTVEDLLNGPVQHPLFDYFRRNRWADADYPWDADGPHCDNWD